MARRGVWQLQKLVLNYCEFSGSSKGVREFVDTMLPQFVKQNPQLPFESVVRRGQHPFWKAEFLSGNSRAVDLRNNDPEEVLRQAVLLRSSAGRKTTLRIKKRHQTSKPSIQGTWTPTTHPTQSMQ